MGARAYSPRIRKSRPNGRRTKVSSTMKHHTWLRAVAAAAIVLLVAAAIVHPSTSGMAARLATASAAFQAIWHWLRGAATHVTTTQLVEAAALAWLVFVFSLVLLARSKP